MLHLQMRSGYAFLLSALIVAGRAAELNGRAWANPFFADDQKSNGIAKRSPNSSPQQPSSEPFDFILVSIPIEALETIPAPVATYLNLPLESLLGSIQEDPNAGASTVAEPSLPVRSTDTVTTTVATVTTRVRSNTDGEDAPASIAVMDSASASPLGVGTTSTTVVRSTTIAPTSSSSAESLSTSGSATTEAQLTTTLTLSQRSSRASSSSLSSSSSSALATSTLTSSSSDSTMSSSSSSSSSSPSSSTSTTTRTTSSEVSTAAPPAEDSAIQRLPSYRYYIGATLCAAYLIMH